MQVQGFGLGDTVSWNTVPNAVGHIVGIITQPSAVVEWPNGARATIGLSMLTKLR